MQTTHSKSHSQLELIGKTPRERRRKQRRRRTVQTWHEIHISMGSLFWQLDTRHNKCFIKQIKTCLFFILSTQCYAFLPRAARCRVSISFCFQEQTHGLVFTPTVAFPPLNQNGWTLKGFPLAFMTSCVFTGARRPLYTVSLRCLLVGKAWERKNPERQISLHVGDGVPSVALHCPQTKGCSYL